jgi:hypothetical protein
MKIVYVTGCLGFIGSYVTRLCLKRGWYVKGVDLCTYAANLDLLEEFCQYKNFSFLQSDINDIEIEPKFTPPKLFTRSRLKFRAKYLPGPSPSDITVTYTVMLDFAGAGPGNRSNRTYTAFIPAGQQYSDWSFESKGVDFWNTNILSAVQNNVAQSLNFLRIDLSNDNHLSMSSADPTQTIISCSANQAIFYPNWFFSGSVNDPVKTEYNFELKKGDLVRFASQSSQPSSFQQSLEYEIIEVYPPTGSNPVLAFKINKSIQDIARSSSISSNPMYYRIPHYIFSSKKEDETNIVINHIKNPGNTSPGITKNINLSQNVDDKLANIVSELKSKIFSTVLTS